MKSIRYAWILICPTILASCNWETFGSRTIPLSAALQIVEHDVSSTSPVVLGNIGSVNFNRDDITKAIHQAQCISGTSNPLVPVLSGPISIALQGSIQQAGGVTPTISATPSLALSYTVTQGEQQQVTVPITFVALSGLPNFYMGQNLANL